MDLPRNEFRQKRLERGAWNNLLDTIHHWRTLARNTKKESLSTHFVDMEAKENLMKLTLECKEKLCELRERLNIEKAKEPRFFEIEQKQIRYAFIP